jgi:hypothetical protein
MNTNNLAIVNQYIATLDFQPTALIEVQTEMRQLFDQVASCASDSQADNTYLHLLASAFAATHELSEEDARLEVVIPLWAQARGKQIPATKPVDEFYRELEYYSLWQLIYQMSVNHGLTKDTAHRMRAIIRRYSNMPTWWLYLCQYCGDELASGYTF